jgi:hypothetical protein
MPRRKRLRSVCHSIAHHAVSSLSYVHPHVLRACRSAGIGNMQINLLVADPCPPQFVEIEPLRLSLKGLREKFETNLAAEGFSVSDLSLATLCFTPEPGKDDYCTVCHATLQSKDQDPVEYIVNCLGQPLSAQPVAPEDAPQAARTLGQKHTE